MVLIVFDDGYDDYIDSVLYADQSNPDFPAYGGYGSGRLIINVVSILDGKETDVYEGTDESRAEKEAVNAFERSHRRAEVLLMRDGGAWKWVFGLPKKVAPNFKPVVTESGFCTHPRCGEINPLDCLCRHNLTPEEIKRYAQYD